MAAAHAGTAGCLTVPKTAVQGAIMVAQCATKIRKQEEGNGTIYLAGMIQTGQTYDVVLELDGHVFAASSGQEPTGDGFVLFGADSSEGLFWSGPMTITIGTDFQSRITGLQKEIGDLQNQLGQLRQEFITHRHVYLTGKGVGHNNTPANTSTPVFPMFPLFP